MIAVSILLTLYLKVMMNFQLIQDSDGFENHILENGVLVYYTSCDVKSFESEIEL
jgi:hypothetical protein